VPDVQKVEYPVRKNESPAGGAQTFALPEHLLRVKNFPYHCRQDYRIYVMSV